MILHTSIIIFVLVTLLWIWSVRITNVSIIDIFWGFSFVITDVLYLLMSGGLNARKILLLLLVTVWGLRLSIYIAWRNIGKGEDFRYKEFRKKYGPERYWWLSYFQTFLVQGILIIIVSLPLAGVNAGTHSMALNVVDYIGVLVWLVGFTFEAGGDLQLSRFKRNPENKGKVLSTGFWKYTRHPNYFGDSAIWCAYALFSVAAGSYWQIIGSIIMILLIIKVSGVALLEKTLNDTKPQYRDYIRKTNAFLPWFPKNK